MRTAWSPFIAAHFPSPNNEFSNWSLPIEIDPVRAQITGRPTCTHCIHSSTAPAETLSQELGWSTAALEGSIATYESRSSPIDLKGKKNWYDKCLVREHRVRCESRRRIIRNAPVKCGDLGLSQYRKQYRSRDRRYRHARQERHLHEERLMRLPSPELL